MHIKVCFTTLEGLAQEPIIPTCEVYLLAAAFPWMLWYLRPQSCCDIEWPQLQAQQIEPSCISCAIMCSSAQCSSSAAAVQPIEMSLPLAEEKRNPYKATACELQPKHTILSGSKLKSLQARVIFSPCTYIAISPPSAYRMLCLHPSAPGPIFC